MGLRDKLRKNKDESPPLPPSKATGYAPRFNVPANPEARNLPLSGEAQPTDTDTPKPVWSKIGNGYEKFKARRNGTENKIPPVEQPGTAGGYGSPAPMPAMNGGYGNPHAFSYGTPEPGYGSPGGYGGTGNLYAAPGPGPGPGSGPGTRPPTTTQEELEDEYGAAPGTATAPNEYGTQQDQEEIERTESDEEVEAAKQQMRFTKQESLSSSRNALRMARDAEETATNSMMRLGDQSEKLADTERNLDMGKAHAHRADDNAREIEHLNSSIFKPHITFNKRSKRAAEEARIINRHVDEREEREKLRSEAFQSQRRVDDSLGGPGSSSRFASAKFAFGKSKAFGEREDPKATKLAQRSRYQFEATASDDELEDELDNNLGDIGHIAGSLNRLGKAMGNEIEEQNSRLGRLGDKTTNLDTKVYTSTYRLDNLRK